MNTVRKHMSRALRFSTLVFVLVVSSGWLGQSVLLADEATRWTVVEASGQARMQRGDDPWRALVSGDELAPGSRVKTGQDGRVVLTQGGDLITVSPNSRMALPAQGERPAATILQTLGTLLFRIESRMHRDFRVETPVLAATIKGTTFTVTVNGEGGALHVVEGLVEVAALESGEVALIGPGETATVWPGRGLDLSLIDRLRPRARASYADAAADGVESSDGPLRLEEAPLAVAPTANEPSDESIGTTHFIPRTLGAIEIDISAVTKGLVNNANLVRRHNRGRRGDHGERSGLDSGGSGSLDSSVAVGSLDSGGSGSLDSGGSGGFDSGDSGGFDSGDSGGFDSGDSGGFDSGDSGGFDSGDDQQGDDQQGDNQQGDNQQGDNQQ